MIQTDTKQKKVTEENEINKQTRGTRLHSNGNNNDNIMHD